MQFANNVNIFQRNLISAYGQSSPRYRQENIGGGINLIYVNEECFILENVTPQNMKTVYDKFRKELVSGSRVMIPNYIYNNKVCLLTVPKTTWENADWWAGMSQYWGSGRAGKEVADMADSINIINTGYNALWSPVDKAFIERVKKIKNRALKDSLCMFYGSFKTKVLVEILAACPYVAAVAGGLYLASFGCRMIFDFRGIVDSIKNSSEEELFILIGSLFAIGSSGKSIKKSFSGKTTIIGKDGALKTKNVTDMKNQVAKDTAGQVLPQGTKPPIKTSRSRTLTPEQIKIINLRENIIKRFNSAKTIKEKLEIIRSAFMERQFKLSAKLCSRILDSMLKEMEKTGKCPIDIEIIESHVLGIRAASRKFHADASLKTYAKDLGKKIMELYKKQKSADAEPYKAQLKLEAGKLKLAGKNTPEALEKMFREAKEIGKEKSKIRNDKLKIADMAYSAFGKYKLAADFYKEALLNIVPKRRYIKIGEAYSRLWSLVREVKAKFPGNTALISALEENLRIVNAAIWRSGNEYWVGILQDHLKLKYNIIVTKWY